MQDGQAPLFCCTQFETPSSQHVLEPACLVAPRWHVSALHAIKLQRQRPAEPQTQFRDVPMQ